MPARSPSLPIRQKYSWSPRETTHQVDCKFTAGRCSGVSGRACGFTLIELLVVISIIAILSVIGVTVYTGIQKSAQDSKRKADVQSIINAYEVKYNQTGSYGTTQIEGTYFSSGQIPKDPGGSDYNIYTDTSSGGVKICANLDNDNSFCRASAQATPPQEGISTTQQTAGIINLVTNSSFETDLSGWVSSDPSGFVMAQSSDAYIGSKSLSISSIAMPYGAVVRTSPEIATIANTNYIVSAWIKASNTAGNQGMAFIVYGPGFDNSPGQTGIPMNGTWSKVSLRVNTSSYTNLGVMFRNTDPYNRPVDVLIDGVRFEKI